MQSWFTIELNGKPWRLEGVSVEVSLLEALKLRGQADPLSREDDEQGGVWLLILDEDRDRRPIFRVIDSAGLSLVMMAGRKIWTLEGLKQIFADHPLWQIEKRYPAVETHPVRRANLLLLLFEHCSLPPEQRSSRLDEGFVSRTADYASVQKLFKEVMRVDTYGVDQAGSEKSEEGDAIQYVDGEKNRFYRPQTIVELFELRNQASASKVITGGIGWRAGRSKNEFQERVFLSAEGIGELRSLVDEGSHWEVGAAVPLTEIAEVLGEEYPELRETLQRFAASPIRNRATLGGQLNTPIGRNELGPVLLALDARVRLASAGGARDLTLDSFFGRKEGTVLRRNELIQSVNLPRNTVETLRVKDCERRLCDAYKIASRRVSCPAMITAAFAVELNSDGEVLRATLVYGALTARPVLAVKAAAALKGKLWCQEVVIGLLKDLDEEVAALGQLDAKDNQRLWVTTLLQKFYHQHSGMSDLKSNPLASPRKNTDESNTRN